MPLGEASEMIKSIGRNNEEENKMFCTKCGKEIQDGKKFCGECGAAVVMPRQTETKTAVAGQTSESYIISEQMAAPDDGKKKKTKVSTNRIIVLVAIIVAATGLLIGGALVVRRIAVENKIIELFYDNYDNYALKSYMDNVYVSDASVTVIEYSESYVDLIVWIEFSDASLNISNGKTCFHFWGNGYDSEISYEQYFAIANGYKQLTKEKSKHDTIRISSDRINDLLLEY